MYLIDFPIKTFSHSTSLHFFHNPEDESLSSYFKNLVSTYYSSNLIFQQGVFSTWSLLLAYKTSFSSAIFFKVLNVCVF